MEGPEAIQVGYEEMISGFTYVHNAIHAGIPIRESILAARPYVDEMVVVDAESTDGTREFLESFDAVDRVLDGKWGNEAGETLARLHAMHTECKYDMILHFEADEVFDGNLVKYIRDLVDNGYANPVAPRIQVEQNHQRIRWNVEYVHRAFLKGNAKKVGHTTDVHFRDSVLKTDLKFGFLWDVTNCFRDNWMNRVEQQARLWNEEPKYRMVPLHASEPWEITREQAEERLKEPHWEWRYSPLALPEILKPLVGVTKYDPNC